MGGGAGRMGWGWEWGGWRGSGGVLSCLLPLSVRNLGRFNPLPSRPRTLVLKLFSFGTVVLLVFSVSPPCDKDVRWFFLPSGDRLISFSSSSIEW